MNGRLRQPHDVLLSFSSPPIEPLLVAGSLFFKASGEPADMTLPPRCIGRSRPAGFGRSLWKWIPTGESEERRVLCEGLSLCAVNESSMGAARPIGPRFSQHIPEVGIGIKKWNKEHVSVRLSLYTAGEIFSEIGTQLTAGKSTYGQT